MSQYTAQFDSLKLTDKTETAIKSWTDQSLEDLNPQQREDYQRLLKVLLFLQARLTLIDPELDPASHWNIADVHLTNIKKCADNYPKNGSNHSLIESANKQADNILNLFRPDTVNASSEFTETLTSFMDKFVNHIENLLQELVEKRLKLKKQIGDFENKLTILETRATSTEKTIQDQSQQHQSQFSSVQEQRSQAFASNQKEQAAKFEKQQEQQKEQFAKNADQFKKEAGTLLEQMREIQLKTEKIYGIVGTESIVGSHKAYADKAKTFANRLFWCAVVLMVVVAGLVIYPLFTVKDINWTLLLYRIPITGILLLPAFYLASEAKKQRDKENRFRELEIKMAAITPYFLEIGEVKVSELPEKEKVKLELAKKLLSPLEEKQDSHTVIPPDVLALIKLLINKSK